MKPARAVGSAPSASAAEASNAARITMTIELVKVRMGRLSSVWIDGHPSFHSVERGARSADGAATGSGVARDTREQKPATTPPGLANRAAGRQVEEMEPLDPDGGLDQVARTHSRVSVEARTHQRLFGSRPSQDLPHRGRVHVPCDLQHLVADDRLHVELDLNHAFRAEQLDELHPTAEARTVGRAFGGIRE